MPVEMGTLEILRMTRRTVMALTSTLVVAPILVIGEKIGSMVKALRHGQMAPNTKASMKMARNMDTDVLPLLMDLLTQVNSAMIAFMVSVISIGALVRDMKASFKMAKEKAEARIDGRMVVNMKENGKEEDNMEWAHSAAKTAAPEEANGLTVRRLGGCIDPCEINKKLKPNIV